MYFIFSIIYALSAPLLAIGCDDRKIHLYSKSNERFEKVIALSGHEDWIRDVQFTLDGEEDRHFKTLFYFNTLSSNQTKCTFLCHLHENADHNH